MPPTADIIALYPPDLARDFDLHLSDLGFGLNPGGLYRCHWREALRLNTLSEVELGLMGLVRSDIPAYVMRHRFPVFAARFARTAGL